MDWLWYVGVYTGILLLTAAAIAFLANRPDRGRRLLAAGLLAIVVGAAGGAVAYHVAEPVLKKAEEEAVSAGLDLVVACPSGTVTAGFPVEVVAAPTGLAPVNATLEVYVNGELYDRANVSEQRVVRVRIILDPGTYSVEARVNGETRCASTVTAVSPGSVVYEAFEKAAESVRVEGLPLLKDALQWAIQQLLRGLGLAVSGLIEASARVFQGVGVYPADALYYLIAMPTMDAPGLKPLWYRVLALSIPLLGVAIVVGVLWQVFWRGEELDLLDYGRELLWALTIMLAAPTIYDVMAGFYNAVALSIAQLGQATRSTGLP